METVCVISLLCVCFFFFFFFDALFFWSSTVFRPTKHPKTKPLVFYVFVRAADMQEMLNALVKPLVSLYELVFAFPVVDETGDALREDARPGQEAEAGGP